MSAHLTSRPVISIDITVHAQLLVEYSKFWKERKMNDCYCIFDWLPQGDKGDQGLMGPRGIKGHTGHKGDQVCFLHYNNSS